MLAEIIGIEKGTAIAFILGAMAGALITGYVYEKKIKKEEEEKQKAKYYQIRSDM